MAYLEVVDFSHDILQIRVVAELCPGDSMKGFFGVGFRYSEMNESIDLGEDLIVSFGALHSRRLASSRSDRWVEGGTVLMNTCLPSGGASTRGMRSCDPFSPNA